MSNEDYDYFGSYDADTQAAQDEANKAAKGSNRYFKWDDGGGYTRLLRIYARRGAPPLTPTRIHWFSDMGDKKGGKLICRQLIGESCPVCDLVAEIEVTGSADERVLAGKMRANAGWLMNVEDQADLGKIKIFQAPTTLAKLLVGIDQKSKATAMLQKTGDFTHPQTGYLVEVSKYDESPWYTATPYFDRATSRLAVSPAKMDLGPKLYDLTLENLIPPVADHIKMVQYLRGEPAGQGGLRGDKGSAGALGGRKPQPTANRTLQAPGFPPPQAPRAQTAVTPVGVANISDDMFGS